MQYILVIAVVLALIIGSPIATILALNALFSLNIEITLATWFASFWLTSLFGGSVVKATAKAK